MATRANNNTAAEETVFLSPETPGKHKADSKLFAGASSAFPAALLAAMAPALAAGCVTQTVLICMLASGLIVATGLGFAECYLANKRRVGYFAFAVALASIALLLILPSAREGLYSLHNAVVCRFDDAYGAYFHLIGTGSQVAGSALFGIGMGVLSGVLSWAATRTRVPGVTLVSAVVLCGGCIKLGLGAAAVAAALGLGAWLSQCRFTQLRGSSYPASFAVVGALSSIGLCAVFFAAFLVLYTPNPAVSSAYNAFEKNIDEARYGSDTLPQGSLATANTMNEGEGSGLSLSVNGQVSDNLLLHGFTGATFENGAWQPISHSAYEGEWRGVMKWLGKQGFIPAEQRAAYDDANAKAENAEQPDTATISVNAENANSKYLYTPYTLRSLDGNGSLDIDGAPQSGFIGTRSYQFTMDDVAQSDTFANTTWLAESPSPYATAENVYTAFAHTNYLEVSEEEEAAIDELIFNDATWDASSASSEYAVISRVRTMLDTLASYSETPAAPDSSQPFARWFLGEARSGNSAYFATAATLALRSQGIPARYAEGYRADMNDVNDAARNGSPLNLNAHDAHAWVEVYLDGVGWTPVEVTPGFYSQNLEADQVIDVDEARSNGSGQIMQSESVIGQMDDEEPPQTPSEIALRFAVNTVLLIITVLIAIGVLLLQRRVRIAHRNRQISKDDQAVSVPALFRYLALVLSEGIAHYDQTRPLDCLNEFEHAFPGIDAEEYRRAVTIHQAYAFGGHKLKPNEMRTLRRFAGRAHACLPATQSATQRIKRYFIKAL